MIDTTPESRKAFWKFQSSAVSFQAAEKLARRIETMMADDELFYPLQVSLHVLYARPFKQQEEGLRIPRTMVPQEYLAQHDTLIAGRDTMFAHHDRHTVKIRDGEKEEYASLVVSVQDGDLHAHQVFLYQAPMDFRQIVGLCASLQERCLYHLGRLQVVCLGLNAVVPDGHYIVSSAFDGMAPLLRKCTVRLGTTEWWRMGNDSALCLQEL